MEEKKKGWATLGHTIAQAQWTQNNLHISNNTIFRSLSSLKIQRMQSCQRKRDTEAWSNIAEYYRKNILSLNY